MKQLGDYAIIKQIGQGPLGDVLLAQHRFLKKTFVLKVLSEELSADKHFLQRFEREVAALSTLNHPHIVKMHNVSESDGRYFLVTDCIVDERGDSVNLDQYLNQGGVKISEEEIVKIVHQIASALDYAHEKLYGDQPFSHLGLKLNNILVAKKKEGFSVYLSDFGLNRVAGPSMILSRTYKSVADTVGTDLEKLPKLHFSFLQNYLFLAPEQKVAAENISHAKADTYAFGVLVYYLLTKRFPEGFFELPSQVAPHYKLNWDRLVKACLQTDPQKRPTGLRKALEELLPDGAAPEPEAEAALPSLQPVLKPGEIVRPEYEADPGAIFQTESVVARYQPQPQEHKEINPLLTEMVVVRGGTFYRGSSNGGRDEMPRHAVTLSSFAIDIHPVTNDEFVRFLEAMGGEKDHNNNDIIRLRESRVKRLGGKLNIESGYAKHPVVGVTWYGAIAYAKWVGKRLPTEAEWEVSAAGGLEESLYPTGKNIERTQANFFSSDTTTVMSYPANGYGLYDMAGNVYEWCQDWYDFHYYDLSVQEPDNPKGPHQGVYRVLRGGCWKSLKEDLRCAHRHRNNPGTMNGTYGFRCAADVS
jgi:formylglycine-generating enzyme required for sulfatase activity